MINSQLIATRTSNIDYKRQRYVAPGAVNEIIRHKTNVSGNFSETLDTYDHHGVIIQKPVNIAFLSEKKLSTQLSEGSFGEALATEPQCRAPGEASFSAEFTSPEVSGFSFPREPHSNIKQKYCELHTQPGATFSLRLWRRLYIKAD